MEFAVIGLTVFGVGYAIKSGLTAKKDSKKNEEYRNKVTEYTVKRGHPIQSKYSVFEKKLDSYEIRLNSLRNSHNNEVYSTLHNIVERHDNNGDYIEINDNLLEESV